MNYRSTEKLFNLELAYNVNLEKTSTIQCIDTVLSIFSNSVGQIRV